MVFDRPRNQHFISSSIDTSLGLLFELSPLIIIWTVIVDDPFSFLLLDLLKVSDLVVLTLIQIFVQLDLWLDLLNIIKNLFLFHPLEIIIAVIEDRCLVFVILFPLLYSLLSRWTKGNTIFEVGLLNTATRMELN